MYIKILFCIFIINVWRKRVRHRKQEVHEVLLHVHMSMSDQHGVGHGGHLVEGTKVLLTTDMVIAELDGLVMGRRFDEELGVPLFAPKQD